jgi:hypothetical protein
MIWLGVYFFWGGGSWKYGEKGVYESGVGVIFFRCYLNWGLG